MNWAKARKGTPTPLPERFAPATFPVLLQPDENHSAPVTGSKPRRGFLSV